MGAEAGRGDVKQVRERLAKVIEFEQLDNEIKSTQSIGKPVSEADAIVYQLDMEQRQLLHRIETNRPQPNPRSLRRLLREEVTEDEITEVVSAWTGIPVTRMLETERQAHRLRNVHERVIKASRRSLLSPMRCEEVAVVCRIPIGHQFVPVRGQQAWERPSEILAEILFDDENPWSVWT